MGSESYEQLENFLLALLVNFLVTRVWLLCVSNDAVHFCPMGKRVVSS